MSGFDLMVCCAVIGRYLMKLCRLVKSYCRWMSVRCSSLYRGTVGSHVARSPMPMHRQCTTRQAKSVAVNMRFLYGGAYSLTRHDLRASSAAQSRLLSATLVWGQNDDVCKVIYVSLQEFPNESVTMVAFVCLTSLLRQYSTQMATINAYEASERRIHKFHSAPNLL